MRHRDILVGHYYLHRTRGKSHTVRVDSILEQNYELRLFAYHVTNVEDGSKHIVCSPQYLVKEIPRPDKVVLPTKRKRTYTDWKLSLGGDDPPPIIPSAGKPTPKAEENTQGGHTNEEG